MLQSSCTHSLVHRARYSSNVTVRNVTVWKCHNDPVIQMGWAVRDISNVSVSGLRVIHTRYNTLPNDVVTSPVNYFVSCHLCSQYYMVHMRFIHTV